MAAVLGIAEHSGWAEFVVVGTRGDTAPAVLARQRVELVAAGLPRNPYHHQALRIPLAEAEALVARVRDSVAHCTRAALADVQARFAVTAAVLQESPFPHLPDALAEVLRSYHLTCAADGMMYREALADAATDLGMNVVRYPRRTDPIEQVAQALGVTRERVAAVVAELGRPLGTPWRKEHRYAAAAAMWVLARETEVRV